MLNIALGAVLGLLVCSLCTANKITELEVENYYLLRKVEELKNELYNGIDGEKHGE